MQKLRFLLILCAALTLAACQSVELPAPIPETEWVDFANPQVGQSTYYVRYTTDCDNFDRAFQFSKDTLILSVVAVDGNLASMEERFTPGSPFYKDGIVEPTRYDITSNQDYALLTDRWNSALFFFYGNDTLRLTADHSATLEQDVCRLTIKDENFVGNEVGRLGRFEVGPLEQKNKTAVSCVPMILSMEAYLIYDKNYLHMSHTIVQDGTVSGWVAVSP
ncbi:MAG: hypothetical protein AAF927_08090 [Bacteroidota bacterium]